MKKQTFITLYFTDKTPYSVDFFRHTLKTIDGVIKREKTFINKYKNEHLFDYLQDNSARLEIWATPDGYHQETLVFSETVQNLIEK